MSLTNVNECLLCGAGNPKVKFKLFFLDKYERNCIQTECGSLFAENVDWLDEAYKINIDPGIIQRVLDNKSLIFGLSKILKFENVLDFGGGTGILTRILRDYSINSFSSDKYIENIFSSEFNYLDNREYCFINLSEIVEHFDNPGNEFNKILDYNPNYLLISTQLYQNQEKDWWYFALDEGQHIYFYSKSCLENFFLNEGYYGIINSNYQFFYNRKISFLKKVLISLLMNKISIKLIRLLLVAKKPKYI